jgi:L-seryl-tRNA(Ser) seleniumtransferase
MGELAALAASRGLVFMEDLGSGLLCPLGVPFAQSEHSARDCLDAGVQIVTFSGDKLLGGPQIGVIAGSKMLIDRMRSHQLHRALRVDKMTLAAFEATLRMYLTGRQGEIPVIKMIEADTDGLQKKARSLCRLLQKTAKDAGADDMTVAVIEADDAIGGGAFPTDRLPGFGVGVHSASRSAESLAAALRTAAFPVIPGIGDGQVVLHVRTLLDGDEQRIAASFAEALGRTGP